MSSQFRKVLSITLVLCVLAIGGLAQAQAAEHAGHHAQHQAATHGTLLCSWMCAAGTVVDAAVVPVQSEQNLIAVISLSYPVHVAAERQHSSSSRAPPSLSL